MSTLSVLFGNNDSPAPAGSVRLGDNRPDQASNAVPYPNGDLGGGLKGGVVGNLFDFAADGWGQDFTPFVRGCHRTSNADANGTQREQIDLTPAAARAPVTRRLRAFAGPPFGGYGTRIRVYDGAPPADLSRPVLDLQHYDMDGHAYCLDASGAVLDPRTWATANQPSAAVTFASGYATIVYGQLDNPGQNIGNTCLSYLAFEEIGPAPAPSPAPAPNPAPAPAPAPEPAPAPAPAGITVSPTAATLRDGDTLTLTAAVQPAGASQAVDTMPVSAGAFNGLTYTPPAQTSVEQRVTLAVRPHGIASPEARCVVTIPARTVVAPPPGSSRPLPVLTATPRDAAGGVVAGRTGQWVSSDPKVATVAPDGTVRPVGVGTCLIGGRVSRKDGRVVPAWCKVTVTP